MGIGGAFVACISEHSDTSIGSAQSAVMQARVIDTTYRDVGWYGPRDKGSCTATALSDTIVLSAAHCQQERTVMTIGVNDQFDDAEIKRRDLTFRIDLDGDLSTAGDTYTYDVARVYHVMVLDQNRGRADVELIGLRLPPGVIGPKTRANAKQRRMLTSFKDNVTPPDLADLVFHAQFDPLTTFGLSTGLQVIRPGVGGNDAVFGPDGGIVPDATSALLPDGGPGGFGSRDELLRFVAPGSVTGMINYPGAPSGTLFGDTVIAINSNSPSAQSAFSTQGDSGGPLIVSSFPNLPPNTDAILGVLGTATESLPLPTGIPSSTHGVFFRDPIGPWIESRLRDLKALAATGDTDVDGIPNSQDNCVNVYNPKQENTNFETEYELKCRAGTCPPNNGAAPGSGALPADVTAWRNTFKGDACDTNSTARITLADSAIDIAVSPANTTCTRYDDYGDSRVAVPNSTCFYIGENDELVSDGRIGSATLPKLATQFGGVVHYGCTCDPVNYVGETDENLRLRKCLSAASCAIALDSARPTLNSWAVNRFNKVTEANVVAASMPVFANPQLVTPPQLTFYQADNSKDPAYDAPAGRRYARWALETDLVRMGRPSIGSADVMLWSYASITRNSAGATWAANPAAANTPNDYVANTFNRNIGGLDTYKPLISKSRIPWYEWIMNPAAHRVSIPEIFAPAQPTSSTGPRIIGFSQRRTRDRSKRITSTLRTQLLGIEGGSTALALPSPKARPLSGDTSTRGFTLTAATGAVTGSIPVLSAATHDVAGAYDWASYADTKVLGIPVSAALFDSDRQRLVVADNTGVIRYRSVSAGVLGNWKALNGITSGATGIVHLYPVVNGYRAIARDANSIWLYEYDAVGIRTLAKFPNATTHDDAMWFSSGPGNEIYIAFQRPGGSGYVLVFKGGVTTGFEVHALSGPVTTDAQGRPHVLVRDKLIDNADSLIALDGTGWTKNYSEANILNVLSNP